MARKSSQSLSVSSGKVKDQWSKSRRKNKTRMVTKRHGRRIRNLSRERKKLLRNISSNGEESKSRKDEFDGVGNEILEKVGPINFKIPNINKNGILIEKDKLKSIEEDRGKIYGDPFLSHQAIGLVWEGIFRNRYHELSSLIQNAPAYAGFKGDLFPADLVAEMLAGFKLTRLARPVYHQDSVDDAKAYISFSERFRK